MALEEIKNYQEKKKYERTEMMHTSTSNHIPGGVHTECGV